VFLTAQADQQKILQSWKTRQELTTELATAEARANDIDRKLGVVNQECAQYTADLAALTDAISGNQATHTNAKIALGHLATYRQLAKVKAATAARLAEIAALRAQQLEPAPVSAEDRQQAEDAQQRALHDLENVRKFIATFAASDIANCPTCHTPTANLQDALAKAKADLPELEQAFKSAKQKIADLNTAAAQRLVWEKAAAALTAEEKQLRASEQSFSDIAAPDASEEELKQVVVDYENLQKALKEIAPFSQAASERRAELSGTLTAVNGQKHKLIDALKELLVTQTDADNAQNTLNELSQQFIQRQNLENEKAQLNIERARFNDKLTTAENDEKKANTLRQWSSVAEIARDALKAAPRLVAKRNLQRLETAINELLQVFGVDFLVKAATDDSPAFIAEFFDGRKQPAKRLSYGQKTVLALAFRVAVNALFADEIGLLALDEPTAYLDQQRIKALAPVLEKLRELSTARGLQCLLVTHETSLSHLFESAVELDA
jgi:exonuclease SbcC